MKQKILSMSLALMMCFASVQTICIAADTEGAIQVSATEETHFEATSILKTYYIEADNATITTNTAIHMKPGTSAWASAANPNTLVYGSPDGNYTNNDILYYNMGTKAVQDNEYRHYWEAVVQIPEAGDYTITVGAPGPCQYESQGIKATIDDVEIFEDTKQITSGENAEKRKVNTYAKKVTLSAGLHTFRFYTKRGSSNNNIILLDYIKFKPEYNAVSTITPYGTFDTKEDLLNNATNDWSTAEWQDGGFVKLSSTRFWKGTLFAPIPMITGEEFVIKLDARVDNDGFADNILSVDILPTSDNSYANGMTNPTDRTLTTEWKTFTFLYKPTGVITQGVERKNDYWQLFFRRGSGTAMQGKFLYIDNLVITPQGNVSYDWEDYIDQMWGTPDSFDKEDGFAAENTTETAYKTFYVDASNGDDTYAGSESKPFKTIEKAKEALKPHLSSMNGHIYVYIRGNVNLDSAITWTTEDSGQNGYNVVYTSWDDTQAEITMKKDYKNFALFDSEKNIYRTKITDSAALKDGRQVYINGVRAVRAKTDDYAIQGAALTDATRNASADGLFYVSYDTEMADFKNQSDMEFVYTNQWTNPRIKVDKIAKVDENRIRIDMNKESWLPHYNSANTTTIGQYPTWIENAYELLDVPGEFYINKTDGYLYYMPRDFENAETMVATIPVGEQAFIVVGDSTQNKVHNIEFKNLAFQYTTWKYPNSIGLRDHQAMFLDNVYPGNARTTGKIADAAVTILDAAYVDIKDCTFAHLGGTGVLYTGVFQKCEVVGNHIFDISSSGIVMGHCEYQEDEYLKYYHPTRYENYLINNHVKNNLIHDVGVEYMSAPGMVISLLINSHIKHNEIYNVNYTGMHVGWGWGTYDYGRVTSYVGNEIMYNYIHDTCQSHLYDGANIYMLGHTGGKNILANNYLENQRNGHGAIYFDEGSDNWHAYHNVIDLKEITEWKVSEGAAAAYRIPSWIHNGPFASADENRDGQVYENYATTDKAIGDITTSAGRFEEPAVSETASWNAAAQSIVDNAGLESAYSAKYPVGVQRLRVMNEEQNVYDIEQTRELQLDITAYTRKLAAVDSFDIHYYSSDESVATVSDTGKITAHNRGNATIYAECKTGEVVVRKAITVSTGIKAKAIESDLTAIAVTVGAAENVSATAVLADNSKMTIYPTVTFDDSSLASVSDGTLTGVAEGTTTMHVSYTIDDITLNKDVTVYVTNYNKGSNSASHETNSTKITNDHNFLKPQNWTGKTSVQSVNGSGTLGFLNKRNELTVQGTSHDFKPAYYKEEVEVISFNTTVTNGTNWPAFVVGAENTEDGCEGNCYVIALKKYGAELWRFNDGERTVIFGSNEYDRRGGAAFENDSIYSYGKEMSVTIGTKDVDGGTNIVLIVDGKPIFDFVDKDANRVSGRYFGVCEWTGNFKFYKYE